MNLGSFKEESPYSRDSNLIMWGGTRHWDLKKKLLCKYNVLLELGSREKARLFQNEEGCEEDKTENVV